MNSKRDMANSDDFSCIVCEKIFKKEIDLETHMLFVHEKFMPQCSTNLTEKQHLESQDLRSEYKDIQRVITGRVAYIRKKFKDSRLANPYSTNWSQPPLERWLGNILRGEGWLLRKDENLTFSKEYSDLEPFLIKLWRPCKRKREIQNTCTEKGYILE